MTPHLPSGPRQPGDARPEPQSPVFARNSNGGAAGNGSEQATPLRCVLGGWGVEGGARGRPACVFTALSRWLPLPHQPRGGARPCVPPSPLIEAQPPPGTRTARRSPAAAQVAMGGPRLSALHILQGENLGTLWEG